MISNEEYGKKQHSKHVCTCVYTLYIKQNELVFFCLKKGM